MVDFVSGAVAFTFVVAGVFFLRFWRQTQDRLFMSFALAFWLLAVNQTAATWLGAADDRIAFVYVLRVLGFTLILAAIVEKNVPAFRKRP